MPSAPISATASSCWRAMPLRWTTVSPWRGRPRPRTAQPSRSSISGLSLTCACSARLQVGAMHHPIGRAGAEASRLRRAAGGRSRRRSRAHDADGLGRHGARGKPRLQPELDQDAAGVGRKLQAGAGFFEPFGFFQNDDAKAPCARAPARPSILRSRHQRRRWCAKRPRADQATLSFTTHSGGRASPAPRSAAKRYSVEQ